MCLSVRIWGWEESVHFDFGILIVRLRKIEWQYTSPKNKKKSGRVNRPYWAPVNEGYGQTSWETWRILARGKRKCKGACIKIVGGCQDFILCSQFSTTNTTSSPRFHCLPSLLAQLQESKEQRLPLRWCSPYGSHLCTAGRGLQKLMEDFQPRW